MTERPREIFDAVHAFVALDEYERKFVDLRPAQRHVHQLALSYLVHPGATHKRFEPSLTSSAPESSPLCQPTAAVPRQDCTDA
ncbi:MAG: hypothetical protein MSC31_18825 [Solirubrobacteraceae bacterium MAG38_C4-C5]|nr:hypothetical protein [Candidatus Siliceabacter maunaloa]